MSDYASHSTLSTFTASDGENIAVQDWPLPEGVALRGVVVLVHGLGEHAGRYEHVARQLNAWGFAVRGYDQCGHGDSDGERGAIPYAGRLVDDLGDMVESTRARTPDGVPVILLGHSLGGLVAGYFASLRPGQVDALVMSSPALDPGLNAFQKFLLATLPRLAPNLRVGNGLDPDFLSHDPDVVAAYRADPRVHDRISARLARFIADAGPRVIARATRWKVPTLLMYAGQDRLVNPQGSRDFAAAAPSSLVTVKCFDELFHEIFNEQDAQPVFDCLRRWLDARFASRAPATAAPQR